MRPKQTAAAATGSPNCEPPSGEWGRAQLWRSFKLLGGTLVEARDRDVQMISGGFLVSGMNFGPSKSRYLSVQTTLDLENPKKSATTFLEAQIVDPQVEIDF